MQTYAAARLDEIDALADGSYRYRPVRHHLGIQSFGVIAWVGAAAGDPIINEYDEDSEPAEELFVVVSGRAIFELEGEKVEATRGTLVFTAQGARRTAVAAEPDHDPRLRRHARNGVRRQRLGAMGATQTALRQGEQAELGAQLEDLIAANPQYPMLVYNLACSESLSGRTADAIDHLRRAVDASEKLRADAGTDSDFDPIRDEPSFKALIGE
jgi:hypothetical protein